MKKPVQIYRSPSLCESFYRSATKYVHRRSFCFRNGLVTVSSGRERRRCSTLWIISLDWGDIWDILLEVPCHIPQKLTKLFVAEVLEMRHFKNQNRHEENHGPVKADLGFGKATGAAVQWSVLLNLHWRKQGHGSTVYMVSLQRAVKNLI